MFPLIGRIKIPEMAPVTNMNQINYSALPTEDIETAMDDNQDEINEDESKLPEDNPLD